jgi:hypothetical protein
MRLWNLGRLAPIFVAVATQWRHEALSHSGADKSVTEKPKISAV